MVCALLLSVLTFHSPLCHLEPQTITMCQSLSSSGCHITPGLISPMHSPLNDVPSILHYLSCFRGLTLFEHHENVHGVLALTSRMVGDSGALRFTGSPHRAAHQVSAFTDLCNKKGQSKTRILDLRCFKVLQTKQNTTGISSSQKYQHNFIALAWNNAKDRALVSVLCFAPFR